MLVHVLLSDLALLAQVEVLANQALEPCTNQGTLSALAAGNLHMADGQVLLTKHQAVAHLHLRVSEDLLSQGGHKVLDSLASHLLDLLGDDGLEGDFALAIAGLAGLDTLVNARDTCLGALALGTDNFDLLLFINSNRVITVSVRRIILIGLILVAYAAHQIDRTILIWLTNILRWVLRLGKHFSQSLVSVIARGIASVHASKGGL